MKNSTKEIQRREYTNPTSITTNSSSKNEIQKRSFMDKILVSIEKAGNRLPDPITLFLIMSILVLIASWVLSLFGVSAINPVTEEKIEVVNLLSVEGLHLIVTNAVSNFAAFPPLAAVLTMMIGVGLAEHSGLISTLMKKTVMNAPQKLIIPTIILSGLVGHTVGDPAFIVLPPIAALIFMSLGRNPMVGLILSYGTVAAGFNANLIISGTDVLLVGISESAAQLVDVNYTGQTTMNYYFILVSTIMLVIIGTWVTKKFTEPKFGKYEGIVEILEPVSPLESKGLRWAGITTLVFTIILALTVIPSNGILRNPETGSILNSPFMSGLVIILVLYFLLPSLVYGFITRSIRSDKDVAEKIYKSIADMAPFIGLAFVAAQMLAYFSWSNIGIIMGINGANFLQNLGFTGIPLFIGFILLIATVNLFIASASAKWALLAPIFIPMFMYLGYSPAVTQTAYRIGDSITNAITPMLAYFAILLTFAKRYYNNVGIGTLISALLPYTVFFGIGWIILFIIWFLLGLPLGPGDGIYLN
ncbi:aminobenzoyl-glutamate transport protein [Ureibacillus acetophenoni]|uniref:Aminobenzoyl-glutamate transport protein n=2 Tax=Ureibacillus acetophenoni TaxID=614649 RepID=A0A285UUC4_9BACL|nr:aminobenzoyl-glutamate transport protein [Ureibacillus acetophenoni]